MIGGYFDKAFWASCGMMLPAGRQSGEESWQCCEQFGHIVMSEFIKGGL